MGAWLGLPPSKYPVARTQKDGGVAPQARALELWACMALMNAPGLGVVSCKILYETFGSACAAAESWREWTDIGIRESVACEFGKRAWLQCAQKNWDATARYAPNFLLYSDAEYPKRLRDLPDAPLMLFYEGCPNFLHGPALTVVGSRKCSPDGILACRTLCRELSEAGITIVSGLAAGIDSEAHKAALGHPGSTIAVMGTGLDMTYPEQSRALRVRIVENGLILTEYAPGSPLRPQNFPRRNRIMAGLSLGVLVVEASDKSGSLITARLAGENGRMVYAVPGRFGSPLATGCAQLIRNGAIPVFDVSDILWDLKPQLQAEGALLAKSAAVSEAVEPAVSGEDGNARIVAFLRENGPTHVDLIGVRLGLDASKVSSALLMLEVDGMVRRFPGMVYGANS